MALSSGTYGAFDSHGRYGDRSHRCEPAATTTFNGGFALTSYTVDGTTFPFIEYGRGQVATGVFVLQNPSRLRLRLAHPNMFDVRPLIHPHAARQKKN